VGRARINIERHKEGLGVDEKGKKIRMTLGDVLEVLEVSLEEVEDEAKSMERERDAETVFDGKLGAVQLVSEGDKLFFRTVTPLGHEKKATIIPIEAGSSIIARVKDLIGKGLAERDINQVLNIYGEKRGLKDEVIDQINRYYKGLRDGFSEEQAAELRNLGIDSSKLKVPIIKGGKQEGEVDSRKIVNTQNFRVSDIIGLAPDKAEVSDEDKKRYIQLSELYDNYGDDSRFKMNDTLMGRLQSLAAKARIKIDPNNLDAAFTALDDVYGTEETIEEVFKVSRDLLRKLLA